MFPKISYFKTFMFVVSIGFKLKICKGYNDAAKHTKTNRLLIFVPGVHANSSLTPSCNFNF